MTLVGTFIIESGFRDPQLFAPGCAKICQIFYSEKSFVLRRQATAADIPLPQEYKVRINDLIKQGDTKANVLLAPGDVIIIPESMF